jgi:glycosyltransferase involved in cell wall biosynthesis
MNNLLIITYPFLSGLNYLSLSYEKYIKNNYDNIFYIPKRKFNLINNKWIPSTKNENSSFIKINDNENYGFQILNFCKNLKIKKIVSFETFMKDSSWVDLLRYNNIQIIDVPMPEWVNRSDFDSNKYLKFNNIYCLTDFTFNLFNLKYKNIERIEWDFCPAFLSIKNINFILNYSGHSNLKINTENIKYIGDKKDRQDIISAYNMADCIVSPSSREGLGLSFYEAKKSKCDIITSNAPPMSYHSSYLCNVKKLIYNESIIPYAEIDNNSLKEQILKYCEDFYERRKKSIN